LKEKDNQTLAEHICIYCKKSSDEVTFNSRDHIIPKGLGGKGRLDKGFVCDTCNNNLLSTLEQFMLRDSILSIPRMFLGPGSEGKTPKTRNDIGKLVLMKSTEQKSNALGVLIYNKPVLIDQLIVQLDNSSFVYTGNKINFKCLSSEEDNKGKELEFVKIFIQQINNYKEKEVKLFFKELSANEYIFGIHKGKFIIACNPDGSIELIKKFITKLKSNDFIEYEIAEPEKSKSSTAVIASALISDKLDRALAKICINILAKEKGHDEILNSKYDKVRDFIIYGVGKNPVHLLRPDNKESLSQHLFQYPADSHQVYLAYMPDGLWGFISFYGQSMRFAIKLCDTIEKKFNFPIGIICDWRNGNEILISEYFRSQTIKALREENELER